MPHAWSQHFRLPFSPSDDAVRNAAGWSLGAAAFVAATYLTACGGPAPTESATEPVVEGAGGSSTETPETPEAPAIAEEHNEATILTWNLEQFPLTGSALERATETITALEPDVIALQEIQDVEAFDQLVDSLDGYEGILNDDPGAYYHVALVYRTDRVFVDQVDTLFKDDWYAFPRPPLRARVRIEAPQPIDFIAVVLHLKAQIDDESADRRRAACDKLDGWVQNQVAIGTEKDYVLLGDFNDELLDPPSWNVFGPFLDQPETYSFLTLPVEEQGDFSYIPFEKMIDHVLVTRDMDAEVGTGFAEVLPLEEELAGYEHLTDHRPVRVTMRW